MLQFWFPNCFYFSTISLRGQFWSFFTEARTTICSLGAVLVTDLTFSQLPATIHTPGTVLVATITGGGLANRAEQNLTHRRFPPALPPAGPAGFRKVRQFRGIHISAFQSGKFKRKIGGALLKV